LARGFSVGCGIVGHARFIVSSVASPAILKMGGYMAEKTIALKERIGRVGQRRQVVIPRELPEPLNIHEGDLVAFSKQANGVLIKRKRLVDSDAVLTPEEARIVRRGEAQLKRGESKPWSLVKDEISR
jgi:AbrB family looped-hinge helix DNA binding protein